MPELDDRVAVCGYTIHLPGEITGEQLFEMCRQKTQYRRDMVALGRYPASIVDESADGAGPTPGSSRRATATCSRRRRVRLTDWVDL